MRNRGGLRALGGGLLDCFDIHLTFIHNFSAIILIKYFFSFVIPPFHRAEIIVLSVNVLGVVELWVEYGWNFM